MNQTLAAWERSQGPRLSAMRESIADGAILRQLLETSCLLELSKLVCAQPALATYADLVIDVISQFFPLEVSALVLETAGLPRIEVGGGAWPVVPAGTDLRTYRLFASGSPVGHLAAGGDTGGADEPFFQRVAAHLSDGLAAVLEGERLRRRAAAAEALHLAASLSEGPEADTLQRLAETLSSLPGALGAELRLVAPLPGGELRASAGLVGAGAVIRRPAGPEAEPPVTVEVSWGDEPTAADLGVLDDIVAAIHGALQQWEERRQLQAQAETDPLTQLGNRRRAYRDLAAALSRAERFDEPVALIALDLDHFKRVNDTLGHPAGDAVLVAVADALRRQLRAYDSAVRLGGEEFLVICPAAGAPAARTIAERLRTEVPEACAGVLPPDWRQTVSSGIAVYPEHGMFPDALLRAADEALYEAKRAGRDRVASAASATAAVAGARRGSPP
jgi:diguanylate cyclase (GGDEF)-like protein